MLIQTPTSPPRISQQNLSQSRVELTLKIELSPLTSILTISLTSTETIFPLASRRGSVWTLRQVNNHWDSTFQTPRWLFSRTPRRPCFQAPSRACLLALIASVNIEISLHLTDSRLLRGEFSDYHQRTQTGTSPRTPVLLVTTKTRPPYGLDPASELHSRDPYEPTR